MPTHRTIALGDLIVAVFDEAQRYTTDPREVGRRATEAVARLLRHSLGDDGPTRARPQASRDFGRARRSFRGTAQDRSSPARV
jgi:hypothetical protein